MPDLLGREKYEDELAAALLLSWDDAIKSARKFETPNWSSMRAQVRDNTEPILIAVGLVAALAMLQEMSGMTSLPAGFRFNTRRHRSLATDIVDTRRSRWDPVDPISWIDKNCSRSVAHRIGVTEVTGAISAGETQLRSVLNRMDVETVAIWNVDPRSNVCDICAPLNGKEESFWSHDFPDGPPAHVNCRCFKTYRTK